MVNYQASLYSKVTVILYIKDYNKSDLKNVAHLQVPSLEHHRGCQAPPTSGLAVKRQNRAASLLSTASKLKATASSVDDAGQGEADVAVQGRRPGLLDQDATSP